MAHDEADLLPIPTQTTYVSETLMNIDSSEIREHCQSLFIYAFALGILALLGIIGPTPVITVMSPRYGLPAPSPSDGLVGHTFSFNLSNLSTLNRFLRVSFVLSRSDAHSPLPATVQYQYNFLFHAPNGSIEELKCDGPQTASVALRAGQRSTPRLVALTDPLVRYSSVHFSLLLLSPHAAFTELLIVVTHGSASHTHFQIAFRVFFAFAAAAAALCLFARLRRQPPHAWSLEQKLTLPLLALIVFANNPFFKLQAYSPSRAYVIFDRICRDVFDAYFCFFVLVIFDALRFKNRKTGRCFYLPKIAIVLALFVASIAHGVYDDVAQFGLPSVTADNVEYRLRGTELVLFLVYILWAASSVVLAGLKVDLTERYKFGLYVAAGGTALGVLAVVRVLFDEFARLRHSSLRFMAGFAVKNAFVLLMAFFHWPCRAVNARPVSRAGEAAEHDPELFVDGDAAVE